ncbi:MAG: hypothetical protein XD93_1112 [candidate division WS6 bacterium 34_10]|uniref:Transglycosylase SLT domain-containing protein n=1 Tax=candidate division WS6 bacterium 34_10 TaxID=1641389 RepID=A0A117LZJ9_9BACT|nr:MAG: hypothetical protein XD93_1112 [candidate division WS6 bacterium 34_10]
MEELSSNAINSAENVESSNESSLSGNDNGEKTYTRREFNKILGMTGLAFLLASCAPDKMVEAAQDDVNLQNNVNTLNEDFYARIDQYVNAKGLFNYEKYSNIYPEFNQYIESIDRYSQEVERMYGIHTGIMKALASSILVSNVGRENSPNTEKKYQRIGIMGLRGADVFPVMSKAYGEQYTYQDLENPNASIYISMLYMAERLKSIQSNGDGKELLSLMLADYYGGSILQKIVKGEDSIENYPGLKYGYDLYNKTFKILKGESTELQTEESTEAITPEQDISDLEVDPGVLEVLTRAESIWFKSKFKQYRRVFVLQVDKYIEKAKKLVPEITKAQLLSIFFTIARAESMGGVKKEIENPDPKFNKEDLAVGWYQIVPKWKHLERFNTEMDTNYTYDDMVNNDVASIEVGIWTLMQYSDSMDMKELMRKFKGGWNFGDMYNQPDDTLWWNRVKYGIKSILGKDPFNMRYMSYLAPKDIYDSEGNFIKQVWEGPFEGSYFEASPHIGVMSPDLQIEE